MSRRFAAIALLVGLGCVAPVANAQDDPLATTYLQAQEFGRRDESDPQTAAYHRDVLLPEFGARYRRWLKECQTALPEADRTAYSFVAAIAADGSVQRMWSDRSAPVFSCLRGHLLFERFSPPPRAPFYLYIHVRFAQ